MTSETPAQELLESALAECGYTSDVRLVSRGHLVPMRAALRAIARALQSPIPGWSEAIEAAAKVAKGHATCGCNGKHGACMVDDLANAIAEDIAALSPPSPVGVTDVKGRPA